jgi:hypothetical protein
MGVVVRVRAAQPLGLAAIVLIACVEPAAIVFFANGDTF